MTTTAVVKDLDVLKQISGRLFTRMVSLPMYSFIFERVEEALRRRVVPAVALAAHRAQHSVITKLGLKRFTGVLAAAIGVMNQPRLRCSSQARYAQRLYDELSAHALFDRPAHHLAID